MATKPANAAQKKWMDDITEFINDLTLGVLYPDYEGRVEMQRHHVMGRSARQSKVDIGHWFVIPVPYELHDPNENHQFHVGHCKKAFVKRYGNQRGIFQALYSMMEMEGYKVPGKEVYNAIMETRA